MNDEKSTEATSTSAKQADSSVLQMWSIVAFAILLYLTLADAAIETFLSGSPVRWWVAGTVAGYLALTIALRLRLPGVWNRFGWLNRATVSFFILLCLLAFTAWAPEGLSRGIKLAGQPTSTLLSVVTAAAIILATVTLVRLKFLPAAASVGIGLLAAYGVAAFTLGIVRSTPYFDLLHGNSLWARLPFWLQGAFIGGLVIVPLALAVQIVNALRQWRSSLTRRWGILQDVALAMSIIMVVSGISVPATSTVPNHSLKSEGPEASAREIIQPLNISYQVLGSALAEGKDGTMLSPAQTADRMEMLLTELEGEARQIPTDTFDVQSVAEKIGREPTRLFEWVRDQTFWVPYRGVLRGPTGVLMDRLGNSLDRALLLAQLLHSAGHTVQLAHANLTEEQAKAMLQKIRAIPNDPMPRASVELRSARDEIIKKYSATFNLDPNTLREHLERISAESAQVSKQVANRVAEQTLRIVRAIGPVMKGAGAVQVDRLEALQDHWWVQWKNGAAWVEMDPIMPDAAIGRAMVEAKETVEPQNLNANLHHEVHLRVVVEQWEAGSLKQLPVLNCTLQPSELFGQRIVLTHLPVEWPRGLNLMEEKEPGQKLKSVVLDQHEWLPVLTVGSKQFAKSSFTDTGEIKEKPGSGPGAVTGALGGLLGGFGGDETKDLKKTRHLTAEWIEYEIHSPGQPVQMIRRELFDLIGPAARSANKIEEPVIGPAQLSERAMSLTGEVEILPLVCQLSSDFIGHLQATRFLQNRPHLLALLRSDPSSNTEVLANRLAQLTPQQSHLYALAWARQQFNRFRNDTYIDRPLIFSFHTHLAEETDGHLSMLRGFDIVTNEMAVRPGGAADPFLIRLEQGVVDTNAEALLLQEDVPVENTAELFAKALSQSIEWLVLRTPSEISRQDVELPVEIRARLLQDLKSGHLVLVPKRLISLGTRATIGWWRINPRTGQTLGMGGRGWGGALTEKTVIEKYEKLVGQGVQMLFCQHYGGGDPQAFMCCMLGFLGSAGVILGIPTYLTTIGSVINIALMSAFAIGANVCAHVGKK